MNKRNISIAFYMGLQSLLFYTILTWFPSMAVSMYSLPFNSGLLITMMQIASLLPAYIIPVITNRKNSRLLFFVLAALFVPGVYNTIKERRGRD